jgi:iron complex transport system ATP-binding protein
MSRAAATLFEADRLTVTIGSRTLVRELSIQFQAGEVWCILGANGAGKTMFLDTVAGLRRAASGVLRLCGKVVSEWPAIDAARLRAFLPQSLHDAFSASVLDVVMLGRHPYLSRWGWEGDAERAMAMAALDAVDLGHMADRDVRTLSGGERQRAAIAALLVQEAPLLLLDEPVAHLDLQHQVSILGHLASLAARERKGVVFSVHDLNLASRFATHAMLYAGDGVIHHGRVADVMSDKALSRAFRCPVERVDVGGRTVFVPC